MRIQLQHINKGNDNFKLIDTLCMLSNELRNECLRIIEAHYISYGSYKISDAPKGKYPVKNTNGYIFETRHLFQIIKDTEFMSRGIMSSKVAKSLMGKIHQSFSDYFKALKDYSINPKKYKARPKPPRFKSHTGRNQVLFESECISTTLNSGYLSIGGKSFVIDIPNIHNLQINEVKYIVLQPCRNGYEIHVIYEKLDEQNIKKKDNGKYMSIDIGVSCLLAITCNHSDWTPTMIKGSRLKNIITDHKTKLRHYRSLLDSNGNKKSKRINSLLYNFENRKNDYLHKLSRCVVDMALKANMTKIIIGHNRNWKQNTKLGKCNALFQSIPYDDLIHLIKYKAEAEGIEVIVTEESYTSKFSFLDRDSFKNNFTNSGKRITRSIYKSYRYGCIHADVNGSLNIMRKVLGDSVFDWSRLKKYKISPTNLNEKEYYF